MFSKKINNSVRFYHKIELEEDKEVSLYMGRNAGAQIEKDIESAQREVLVISPYVSSGKVKDLMRVGRQGVRTKLIFGSKEVLEQNDGRETVQLLIDQRRHINQSEVDLKEKKFKQNKVYQLVFKLCLLVSVVCTPVVLILGGWGTNKRVILFALLLGLAILSFYALKQLINKAYKIRQMPIYSYSYSKNMDFKYLREYGGANMFVHSKVYIVDRKVAYLGSANFTHNGFGSNFETRVRITDEKMIEELVAFFDLVYSDNQNFPEHIVDWLGTQIYAEPSY